MIHAKVRHGGKRRNLNALLKISRIENNMSYIFLYEYYRTASKKAEYARALYYSALF